MDGKANIIVSAKYSLLRRPVSYALDPKLLDRLDKWRKAQDVPPTKTAIFETALREFLERREKKEAR